MKILKISVVMLMSIILFSGFWSGQSAQELRAQRVSESTHTLQLLYEYAPVARSIVASAYGYATFSSVGVNVFFLSGAGGTGMAHNNKTGHNIYMNMASAGLGLGLGVKDFRAIFIFANKKAFDYFVTNGWEANAQADAAAKLNSRGGALNGAVSVMPGVRLYKLTQNGLALQVTIQGTKYWPDSDLN